MMTPAAVRIGIAALRSTYAPRIRAGLRPRERANAT